jgi:hypothetical protein
MPNGKKARKIFFLDFISPKKHRKINFMCALLKSIKKMYFFFQNKNKILEKNKQKLFVREIFR